MIVYFDLSVGYTVGNWDVFLFANKEYRKCYLIVVKRVRAS